jgi:hypothetical protein
MKILSICKATSLNGVSNVKPVKPSEKYWLCYAYFQLHRSLLEFTMDTLYIVSSSDVPLFTYLYDRQLWSAGQILFDLKLHLWLQWIKQSQKCARQTVGLSINVFAVSQVSNVCTEHLKDALLQWRIH